MMDNTKDLILEILTEMSFGHPRSGDCIPVSDAVTSHLQDAGREAVSVVVIGWVDVPGNKDVIGEGHRATLVDDRWIVDCTARQYDPSLPQPWVVDEDEYCKVLAERLKGWIREVEIFRPEQLIGETQED